MEKLNLILSQYPGGEPFYEFDISEKPLSSILQVDLKQLTGIFTPEGSDSGYFVAQLAKFLGKLATEKILLYVCADCGDLGCGALTAQISFSENSVVWSDFAYENASETFEKYPNIGPFEFDKASYMNAFEEMVKKVKN
ncbi:MAG: hypothetical protein ACKO7D_10055 [Bacteroidota bacterium]